MFYILVWNDSVMLKGVELLFEKERENNFKLVIVSRWDLKEEGIIMLCIKNIWMIYDNSLYINNVFWLMMFFKNERCFYIINGVLLIYYIF